MIQQWRRSSWRISAKVHARGGDGSFPGKHGGNNRSLHGSCGKTQHGNRHIPMRCFQWNPYFPPRPAIGWLLRFPVPAVPLDNPPADGREIPHAGSHFPQANKQEKNIREDVSHRVRHFHAVPDMPFAVPFRENETESANTEGDAIKTSIRKLLTAAGILE